MRKQIPIKDKGSRGGKALAILTHPQWLRPKAEGM